MKRRINIQVHGGVENSRVSEAAGMRCFAGRLRPDKRRPNVDSFVVYKEIV